MLLVPDSSGKTKRLRIPHYVIHMVIITLIVAVSTMLIFSLRSRYYQLQAEEIQSNLIQSHEQNNRLEQEKSQLDLELEHEKDRLDAELKEVRSKLQQKADEAESLQDEMQEKMEYYEEKARELEQRLDELQKAKDVIYDELSQRELLPSIHTAGYDTESVPVFASMGGPSSTGDIDAMYASLDVRVNRETEAYHTLLNQIEKVKPNLTNYPTIWPVRGIVTSEVGYRTNPFGGTGEESHTGIDISVPIGTDVRASGGGVVSYSGVMDGYGYIVIVNHDRGTQSYYAHNSQLLVSEGERVSGGQVIAKSGNTGRSTGPHVHFEIRVNGIVKNPREFVREAM